MAEPIVTLFGGGPVGSLLATLLAQRGCRVDVYERRPDMRKQAVGAGRSINLAVSARGLHALRQVGLDGAVLDCAVPMRGRCVHDPSGRCEVQVYGRGDGQVIHSMSRAGLNQILLDRAEATGLVRLRFGTRLESYDFAASRANLVVEATREQLALPAPVVVGTDGSASALRASMQGAGLRQALAPLDFGYKELTLPPSASGDFAFEPHALHIWPRGRYMLIALPNPDRTFTCTLFLPHQSDGLTPSFADLADDAAVAAFMARQFSDVPPRMPDGVLQFARAPIGHMATLRCGPWSAGPALLVGDAAHAIVPFFGQGMNAGFESCVRLVEAIDREGLPATPAEWAQAFARFWPDRKRDTDAIADLALENFVEMRDKVADPQFLLQRAAELAVQARLGDAYWTRYQLVSFSLVPYAEASRIGQVQGRLLADACAGAADLASVDLDALVAAMAAQVVPQLAAAGV
ncbi:MAG: FAD-dependent monooxygenase [Deltaproteobacteria bacterium]|nr:FAD-dependent monooxygenase [Deltaproteobacteria bacterium]